MQERVAAIREVTNLFRMERTVYLVLTSTALLLLLASAGALLFKQGPQMVILAGLFGSSGIITVTIHRVIRMWERALDILNPRGITP